MKTLDFLRENKPKKGDKMKLLLIDDILYNLSQINIIPYEEIKYRAMMDRELTVVGTNDPLTNRLNVRVSFINNLGEEYHENLYYPQEIDFINKLEVELL